MKISCYYMEKIVLILAFWWTERSLAVKQSLADIVAASLDDHPVNIHLVSAEYTWPGRVFNHNSVFVFRRFRQSAEFIVLK